jgi:hypothetical protein
MTENKNGAQAERENDSQEVKNVEILPTNTARPEVQVIPNNCKRCNPSANKDGRIV